MVRSLWVGIAIALPSGAGVALSVVGGNAGSLVGVAISASLLPPAVNAVSIVVIVNLKNKTRIVLYYNHILTVLRQKLDVGFDRFCCK